MMPQDQEITCSIIIPVFNSEKSVGELFTRIIRMFEAAETTYEIIFVDDSSTDRSWEKLQDVKRNSENVKIIRLMKNFGQHNAILCGLQNSKGKYLITMDDDLQNPPEEIPKLINAIQKDDVDVVIGAINEKKDRFYKKLGSKFIQYLNKSIFDKPKNLKLSSFRIMKKNVADEMVKFKTPYPYITGMLLSLTKNISNVTVEHHPRKYGSSNYRFRTLLSLSFNLIINYTSLPLRFFTTLGIFISVASFFTGLYYVGQKLFVRESIPGWTSVVVMLSFFNGLLLIILSVMGEYFARIIGEISNRPQYVIRDKE